MLNKLFPRFLPMMTARLKLATDCHAGQKRGSPFQSPFMHGATFPFTLLIAYAMLIRRMLWMRGGEENEMI